MPAFTAAWRAVIWPCAGLEHLAHDHVVDLLGADAGALERGLDREPAEVGGAEAGERAGELADRRAGRRDDDGTGHGGPPLARATPPDGAYRRGAQSGPSGPGSLGARRLTAPVACPAMQRASEIDAIRRRSSRARRATRSRALPLPERVPRRGRARRRAGDVRRACRPRRRTRASRSTSTRSPLPELAPDEAYVAVMASSINFNTVWTSIFEPLPTFGFLDAPRQGERVGRAPRPAVPRGGLATRRASCCASARRCATGSRATR